MSLVDVSSFFPLWFIKKLSFFDEIFILDGFLKPEVVGFDSIFSKCLWLMFLHFFHFGSLINYHFLMKFF